MEEWREVPDFYLEASSLGRVRSVPRTVACKNGRSQFWPGKILTPNKGNQMGHLYVTARKKGADRQSYYAVHALVAAAFHGPKPEGKQVCHYDGNVKNNRPDNLRYGTPTTNCEDMVRHETGRPKLSRQQVEEIRRLKLQGETTRALGRAFNIDHGHVSRICAGKSWQYEE